MKYYFFKQKNPWWCLPACLQSVLKLRRFMEPSQEEIAEALGVRENGVDVSEFLLNEFLAEYNMECEHVNPFKEFCFSPDIFLETRLTDQTDVLASYDFRKLHGLDGVGRHFSIVAKYNSRSGRVFLQDPSLDRRGFRIVDLFGEVGLVDSMQAREDERYGFYVLESL